jgi:hypothetical protein
MPRKMNCVHATYTPAPTIQPTSANRQLTVWPTTTATVIPRAVATDIRTATVSRNNSTTGFTLPS